MELINPEILAASEEEAVGLKGCLSMPGLIAEVRRAEKVRVAALDRGGRRFWVDAEGELARCFQHEIDHLDWVLMTDRAIRLFRMRQTDGDEIELNDVDL